MTTNLSLLWILTLMTASRSSILEEEVMTVMISERIISSHSRACNSWASIYRTTTHGTISTNHRRVFFWLIIVMMVAARRSRPLICRIAIATATIRFCIKIVVSAVPENHHPEAARRSQARLRRELRSPSQTQAMMTMKKSVCSILQTTKTLQHWSDEREPRHHLRGLLELKNDERLKQRLLSRSMEIQQVRSS